MEDIKLTEMGAAIRYGVENKVIPVNQSGEGQVVVAEDDPGTMYMLKRVFEKNLRGTSLKLNLANDGKEALELIMSIVNDTNCALTMVYTDYYMPNVNGELLLREISSVYEDTYNAENFSKKPICILSSSEDSSVIKPSSLQDEGIIEEFVQKPVMTAGIAEAVRNTILNRVMRKAEQGLF